MVQNEHASMPTLHVEAILDGLLPDPHRANKLKDEIIRHLRNTAEVIQVGHIVKDLDVIPHGDLLFHVEVTDYLGPDHYAAFHLVKDMEIEVDLFVLRDHPENPSPDYQTHWITQPDDDQEVEAGAQSHFRTLRLPNYALKDEWKSLVFDDCLPAKLLHKILRMMNVMSNPDLNLSLFNLNRLCLLYGPSGSGKSTLCRAIAQRLSIRLGLIMSRSILVEINANALLSKYFGESARLITHTFHMVTKIAKDFDFVFVVIDEVETLAGSRKKATDGSECNDSLRATNQLLIALDSLRSLSNVVVLCTSNIVEAIDTAFLDRVDIKQFIPRPTKVAIYDIFRSCINELVRCDVVGTTTSLTEKMTENACQGAGSVPMDVKATIPTFAEANVKCNMLPWSPGSRILRLAKRCEGLSGRTLRRLPILGLSEIWHYDYSLDEVVAALEHVVKETEQREPRLDLSPRIEF